MRTLQVGLLVLAVLALGGAAAFAGSSAGDVLWRAGVAALLVDMVCLMLWPTRR